MRKKYFSSFDNFFEEKPAWKLILNSLKEILPNKEHYLGFILCVIVGAVLAFYIGFSARTVELTRQVCDVLFSTLLALFGCIFAVYSILLAFLSDEFIKKLFEISYQTGNDEISYLKASTIYYESVLFIYFIAIIISGLVKLLLICFDEVAFGNLVICNIVASVLLLLYFTFSFRVIYEIKSTIYNTVILFRASVGYRLKKLNQDNLIDEQEGQNDKD